MGGYIGAKTGTLVASASDIRGDISATDTTPEITLKNTTETDADGTRSGKITFKGEQSGGEESVLAQIQGSHDGTADDEKGDLIFKTNDGSDGASPTERLRIDSDGNVGIRSSDPSGQFECSTGTGTAFFTRSAGDDGSSSSCLAISTGASTTTIGATNPLTFNVGATGTASNAQTERMRIEGSSGNVGIGTTSPSEKLVLANSSNEIKFGLDSASHDIFSNGKTFNIGTADATVLRFFSNNSERMRMHQSNGNIYIGTTSAARGAERLSVTQTVGEGIAVRTNGRSSAGYIYKSLESAAGTHYIGYWETAGGTNVGKITHNNSTTSYTTTSDYRLKENVTDVTDGITRVKQLAPKRFNFIADADTTVDGFIAHEAAAVVPEAVTGEKDAMTEEVLYVDGDEIPDGKKVGDVKTASKIEPQGIDQGKLVPLLTAALQEAIAKIETLETKVAALEAE